MQFKLFNAKYVLPWIQIYHLEKSQVHRENSTLSAWDIHVTLDHIPDTEKIVAPLIIYGMTVKLSIYRRAGTFSVFSGSKWST